MVRPAGFFTHIAKVRQSSLGYKPRNHHRLCSLWIKVVFRYKVRQMKLNMDAILAMNEDQFDALCYSVGKKKVMKYIQQKYAEYSRMLSRWNAHVATTEDPPAPAVAFAAVIRLQLTDVEQILNDNRDEAVEYRREFKMSDMKRILENAE